MRAEVVARSCGRVAMPLEKAAMGKARRERGEGLAGVGWGVVDESGMTEVEVGDAVCQGYDGVPEHAAVPDGDWVDGQTEGFSCGAGPTGRELPAEEGFGLGD